MRNFVRFVMSIFKKTYRFVKNMSDEADKKYYESEYKKCIFDDRKKDSENLLLIVAGYQEYLWEIIFNRILKYIPDDFDVCVCVPGAVGEKRIDNLRDLTAKNGWSFVQTHANRLALTQNVAIHFHAKANWIYKLDEDIFIGSDYFNLLKEVYIDVMKKSPFVPGLVFPVINLNGHTSEYFINHVLDENSKSKIHEHLNVDVFKRNSTGIFWSDEYVGRLIWELSPCIDECVEMLKNNPEKYTIAPFGVSIGAFLMTRDFYDEIGKFKLAGEGELGVEERDVWAKSSSLSRPMIIATRVFAGHFGYYTQKAHVKELFDDNRELFL